MRSRISSTSSYHTDYLASERSGTRSAASGSQRSSPASGPLSNFASRLSTAGRSYHAQTHRFDQPAPSGQSYAYQPTAYSAAAHSEYGSVAESTYETATSRPLSHSSSDLFDINIGDSSRDFYDIDPHRASGAATTRVPSVAEALSQAGSESFHLSARRDVGRALADGRLRYSTDSSRRLTSYEGSSVAPDSVAGSNASSYRERSMTPSDLSALRAARALGRFVPSHFPRESSVDSDYSAYPREGDDVVAPLRASRFNPIPSMAPSDPYSVAAAATSRVIDRTPSFSGRPGDYYRPTVDEDYAGGDSFRASNNSSSGRLSQFGGADIESLSAAGAGPSTSRQGHTTLRDLLKEPL